MNLKKIFIMAFISITSAFALSVQVFAIDQDVWQQLVEDFAIINAVAPEDEERFVTENQMWIEEVNTKLENFLESVPLEYHYELVIRLLGGNPLARHTLGNFFQWWAWRGTGQGGIYTLRPSFTTMHFNSVASQAWASFFNAFDLRWHPFSVQNSLYNQFWCHFFLDVETMFFGGTWDLETWRPVVGTSDMIKNFCNP